MGQGETKQQDNTSSFPSLALALPTDNLQRQKSTLRQHSTSWSEAEAVDHQNIPWTQPDTSNKQQYRDILFIPTKK